MNTNTKVLIARADKKTYAQNRVLMRIKNSWQLYLLLLLPVLYMILFAYTPMYGAQIAFKKYSALNGIIGSPWVGFYYFEKFFKSYQFGRILTNTLSISIYSLVAGFPVPILLALALNAARSNTYRKTIQMVTYLPHFISTVVMVSIILQVFNARFGLYGRLLSFFGMQITDILGSPDAFPHLYVLSGIWQNMGWGTIIYLAALAGVDTEQHEAAIMDGASRFKRVIHIDIPAILPTIVILLIMNAGQIMSVGFEKAFLMQNPLNLPSSELISTYVYKIGLNTGSGDFSYAAAIGLFNSVINLILLTFVNFVAKRVGDVSLW